MTELIKQLIEDLRTELKEYGEMLALLDEQQEHLMARRSDVLLDGVTRINAQTLVLKRVRAARETTQRALAEAAGHADCSGLLLLADHLPEDYRPLLKALVAEINQLLTRVQQRGRQNFLVLSRTMEVMQRFVNWLTPGHGATVYGDNGTLNANPTSRALYEAVG